MKYKVISLWQPWASLVVGGHKRIETRGWDTPYRGLLLIHATVSKAGRKIVSNMSDKERFHFKQCLPTDVIPGVPPTEIQWDELPFGAIIGAVNLCHTIQSQESYMAESVTYNGNTWQFSKQEKMFGDFSRGRYLWLLSNPVRFDVPIPAKGLQGFWNHETSDRLTLPPPYVAPKPDLFG